MLLLQNSENIQPTFYCRKEFFPGAPHHCALYGFGNTAGNPCGIPLYRLAIRFELLLAAKVCLKCTMFGYCQRMKLGNSNTNTQSYNRVHARLCSGCGRCHRSQSRFGRLQTFCATAGKCCPTALFLITYSCLRERPYTKCRNVRPVTERRRQLEMPVPSTCLPICSPAQKVRVQVA